MRSTKLMMVLMALVLLVTSNVMAKGFARGRRGPRPPAIVAAYGLATEDEKEHRFDLVVVPAPPEKSDSDDSEVDETSDDEEKPALEDLELLGHFRIGRNHLLLSNVVVTTSEVTPEGSDEAITVVSAMTASLNLPPSREEMEECRENGEKPTLSEVGTISITIEAQEDEDGKIYPALSGTASFTDKNDEEVSLTLEGKLRRPRRRRRNRRENDEDNAPQQGDGEIIDGDELEGATAEF